MCRHFQADRRAEFVAGNREQHSQRVYIRRQSFVTEPSRPSQAINETCELSSTARRSQVCVPVVVDVGQTQEFRDADPVAPVGLGRSRASVARLGHVIAIAASRPARDASCLVGCVARPTLG